MPRQILNHKPDIVLTGHGGAVVFEQERVVRWQALFTEVLEQPHPDMGMVYLRSFLAGVPPLLSGETGFAAAGVKGRWGVSGIKRGTPE